MSIKEINLFFKNETSKYTCTHLLAILKCMRARNLRSYWSDIRSDHEGTTISKDCINWIEVQ